MVSVDRTRMIDKQNFIPPVIRMVDVKEEKEKDSIDPNIQDLIENNKNDSLVEEKPEILEIGSDKELQQLWKGLVDQLFQSIQEANFSSLRAVELLRQISTYSQNFDDSTNKCIDQVSSPLNSAIESLGLTLIAVEDVGKSFPVISKNPQTTLSIQQLEDDIKKEITYKIESNDIEFNEFMDCTENDITEDNLEENPDDALEENCDEPTSKLSSEFKCNECDYETTAARYLKAHKKNHKEGKFGCIKCSYSNHKPYLLKAHIVKVHQIEKIDFIYEREKPDVKYYLCQHCPFLSSDEYAVTSHTQSKHKNKGSGKKRKVEREESNDELIDDPIDEENEFKCTRCTYVTKRKIYFEDHMSGSLNFVKCPWCDAHFKHSAKGKLGRHLTSDHDVTKVDNKWSCQHCENDFEKIRDLLHHLAKTHNFGTMLHCQKCDFSSVDRRNLVVHAEFHNTAEFPCSQCDFMAKSKNRLRKHVYSSHKQTECPVCKKSFKNMQEYFNHSKSHHGARPVCDICGKSFSCAGALGTHMKALHGDENLQCEMCDFNTQSQSSFSYHMNTRHKGEIYYCDTCDYNTPRKGNLTAHIKNKHQNIKHTCDVCDMKFTTSVAMKRHKKIKHSTDVVKFKCDEAGCAYTTHALYFLKTHVEKVHKGIRWPCDLCDYVGGYKGDLNRHKKIVHEGFILDCSWCEFRTPKKYHLKEHLLKEHGIEETS